MLAHGFKLDFLGDLVFGRFALATPQETRARSKPMIVVWMTITPAGRKAIGD
jgi:hypothetical protein